jgi:hypothetical protein
MWLPDLIYKRAPYYWMLLGVLFIFVGTMRTMSGDPMFGLICLGSGVVSCFWSLRVAMHRRTRGEAISDDPELDQTCELNFRPD